MTRESMYLYQLTHYKMLRTLKVTAQRRSQDSKKLFRGAEGILWSLRPNSVMHTSAQDMCRIVLGAVHV